MREIFEDILDDIEPLQTNSAVALSDDDSFWIEYADIDYDQSADDYDMSMTASINFTRTITDNYIEELKTVIEDEFIDVFDSCREIKEYSKFCIYKGTNKMADLSIAFKFLEQDKMTQMRFLNFITKLVRLMLRLIKIQPIDTIKLELFYESGFMPNFWRRIYSTDLFSGVSAESFVIHFLQKDSQNFVYAMNHFMPEKEKMVDYAGPILAEAYAKKHHIIETKK